MELRELCIIFMFTVTLHNIEEGLWLPQWSRYAGRYHKPVEPGEFHFALIILTSVAYLISVLTMVYPNVILLRYLFAGYVGTMLLNVFFPHLIGTLVLKSYVPGLITGLLLNLPLNGLILYYMIRDSYLNLYIMIITIIVFSIFTLSILTPLFKVGRKLNINKKSDLC